MYHVELRQFPRNANRFNLSEQDLRMVVEPWVHERIFEFGELKWSPAEANLIVIEGPQIPIPRLSMGRGWRIALRQGVDVTERVLAAGREQYAAPPPYVPGAEAIADPLGLAVELASLLGSNPSGLLTAWRTLAARSPGLAPSETLALAERELGGESSPAA
jgi:hypothetical protein